MLSVRLNTFFNGLMCMYMQVYPYQHYSLQLTNHGVRIRWVSDADEKMEFCGFMMIVVRT